LGPIRYHRQNKSGFVNRKQLSSKKSTRLKRNVSNPPFCALAVALALALGSNSAAGQNNQPTIVTDQPDHPRGSAAHISGVAFQPSV
jgi:hypothetical protein